MKTAMQELIDWAISLQYNEQQCIDWMVIKNKAEQLLEAEKMNKEALELEYYITSSEEHDNLKSNDGSYYDFHRQSKLLIKGAELGAKWQSERMYSEEEIFTIIDKLFNMYSIIDTNDAKEWFKQNKKHTK